ncbi:MAG: glycosyltransferase family A protein [Planctomycetia bacterium]|nr:glycosyltransferase family A protein [Planctomycetia bacterium]
MTPHSHDTIPAANRPLFSVIVPFLNEEEWLPKCLAALRAQTIDPTLVEWILIDNGSTDRSAEIVRAEIVRAEPRATLLAEPRRDPYIARNRGILAARGQHIVFLDADCLAEPNWLEAMQRELAILLGYLAYPSPRSLALQLHEDYEDAKLRQVLASEPSECWFGHAGNMVVRADVFKEIGLFEPMPVVGDTEIIHRLLKRQPDAVVRYAAAARVVHAEVNSFRMCLTKTYEIGAHSETLARVISYRTLSLAERLRVVGRCCRMHGYGPGRWLALWGILGLGYAAFLAGRLTRGFAHLGRRG